MAERTFVMLKPDTVQRDLVGEILSRFERRGLKIAAMKLVQLKENVASELYAQHKGKEFYEKLIEYATSGPCVVCVIEGFQAIKAVRKLIGATDPIESEPGSIRGDYGLFMRRNVVHAADSPETAKREINLFFRPDEILSYKKADEEWVYES
jgi:nucleoside-diphosphate kinase